MFDLDTRRMLSDPINNMTKKIVNISNNPIDSILNEDNNFEDNDENITNSSNYRFCFKKNKANLLETKIIENTISKIGALLALGFGEAGSEIVAKNMKTSADGDIDPMIEGKKVMAVYGFCDIRNFTDTTEELEEDVMIFVNRIGEIVHEITNDNCGFANKNIGDAFLLVWKFDEKYYVKSKNSANYNNETSKSNYNPNYDKSNSINNFNYAKNQYANNDNLIDVNNNNTNKKVSFFNNNSNNKISNKDSKNIFNKSNSINNNKYIEDNNLTPIKKIDINSIKSLNSNNCLDNKLNKQYINKRTLFNPVSKKFSELNAIKNNLIEYNNLDNKYNSNLIKSNDYLDSQVINNDNNPKDVSFYSMKLNYLKNNYHSAVSRKLKRNFTNNMSIYGPSIKEQINMLSISNNININSNSNLINKVNFLKNNNINEIFENITLKNVYEVNQIVNMSLIAFAQIIIHVHKSKTLDYYRHHKKLTKRMPGFCVKIGFGLHLGWSIEGAIGSNFKIDASYLSPHVNMAGKLEENTKAYKVNMILSEEYVSYLSPYVKTKLRIIDKLKKFENNKNYKFCWYTFDIDLTNLSIDNKNEKDTYEDKMARYLRKRKERKQKLKLILENKPVSLNSNKLNNIYNSNLNIKSNTYDAWEEFESSPYFDIIRKKYSDVFYNLYNRAIEEYSLGNFNAALDYFLRADDEFTKRTENLVNKKLILFENNILVLSNNNVVISNSNFKEVFKNSIIDNIEDGPIKKFVMYIFDCNFNSPENWDGYKLYED